MPRGGDGQTSGLSFLGSACFGTVLISFQRHVKRLIRCIPTVPSHADSPFSCLVHSWHERHLHVCVMHMAQVKGTPGVMGTTSQCGQATASCSHLAHRTVWTTTPAPSSTRCRCAVSVHHVAWTSSFATRLTHADGCTLLAHGDPCVRMVLFTVLWLLEQLDLLAGYRSCGLSCRCFDVCGSAAAVDQHVCTWFHAALDWHSLSSP